MEEIPITKLESEVLEIIKKVSVEGHVIQESPSTFSFEENIANTSFSPSSIQLTPVVEQNKVEEDKNDENISKQNISQHQFKSKKSLKCFRKFNYLTNTAKAANDHKVYLEKKIKIKETYYSKKNRSPKPHG